ncbi:unnamed protein product, partial [Aureobasidium uvarum]
MRGKTKCDKDPTGCSRCRQRGLLCAYPQDVTIRDTPSSNSTNDAEVNPQETTLPGPDMLDDHQALLINDVSSMERPDRLSPRTGFPASTPMADDSSHSLTKHFDFSALNLVCTIDVDDIASRWLNTYVPLPGQVVKNYPPTQCCPMELLASFQAYLIYAMVLFLRLKQASTAFLRQAMINLQDLAWSTTRHGVLCLAEQQHTRPTWEEWIVTEVKRRSLYVMYMFDDVISKQEGIPTFLGVELVGLPVPGSKSLWSANGRRSWQESYNLHLADWPEGGLRIDELWAIPQELREQDVARRRSRVEQWLEDLDEFGMMIYTVTSCTHATTVDVTRTYDHRFNPGSCFLAEESCENALNLHPPAVYSIFDRRQRAIIILIASIAATFSGFASNIYFPAIPTISHDLDVSFELINLSVTAYLVFQGLAPSLWGPISDVKGRRIAYIGTFLVFLGSCVGLALTRNYATLIVLRCLQSTGSASTIAIGSGVVGDVTTREDRGGYMAIFQAGLLVPVAIGPVIGGALTEALGWRSIFGSSPSIAVSSWSSSSLYCQRL